VWQQVIRCVGMFCSYHIILTVGLQGSASRSSWGHHTQLRLSICSGLTQYICKLLKHETAAAIHALIPEIHKSVCRCFHVCLTPFPPLGNTIHLQRPAAISARVSRLTYGINVGDNPQPACHHVGRCIQDRKGRTWCETHFRPLVKIDDVVQIGERTQPLTVYPLPDEPVVHVPIFATESADVSHVTEPGMHKIGVLSVQVNKAHKFKLGPIKAGRISSDEYKVELSFRFGSTEVEVHAYDVTNKCSSKVEFNFSSQPAGAEHQWHVNLPGTCGAPLTKAPHNMHGGTQAANLRL